MKKSLFLLVLISVLAVTGCTEEKENPQNVVGASTVPSESEQKYANDGVQQVQVTGPVTFSSDIYWQWHEQTTEILESKVGTNVVIYCYNTKYAGKLEEVDGFYVVLDESFRGKIYISIDTICVILA